MTEHRREGEASIGSLAATFKALSDETRLQIMLLLLEGEELCVCDVVGTLGLTQSKASRHLRYLFNAGLVDDRREGTWMHYGLSKTMNAGQRSVVAALVSAVSEDQKKDLAEQLKEWLNRKATRPSTACGAGQ